MRVLGIDCGTEYTGYGVVKLHEDGKLQCLDCGAIKLSPRNSMASRLPTIFDRLTPPGLIFILTDFLFLVTLPVLSQQSATITYTQNFPGSDPSHYMISLSSDGHAHYEGNGRLITPSKYSTDDSVPDNEQLDF